MVVTHVVCPTSEVCHTIRSESHGLPRQLKPIYGGCADPPDVPVGSARPILDARSTEPGVVQSHVLGDDPHMTDCAAWAGSRSSIVTKRRWRDGRRTRRPGSFDEESADRMWLVNDAPQDVANAFTVYEIDYGLASIAIAVLRLAMLVKSPPRPGLKTTLLAREVF